MKTLRLLSPFLALAALLAGGFLYYYFSTRWQTRLAAADANGRQLQASLTQAQTDNTALRQQLLQLDQDLGATKTRLTEERNQNAGLSRQASELRAQLSQQTELASRLRVQVQNLDQALAQAKASAASPETVARYRETITALQSSLTAAREAAARPPTPAPPVVAMLSTNRGRTASVVGVGPSNAFVVLNYGSDHGAKAGQTLSIRHDQTPLARVRLSDVRAAYSIGQVEPDSLHGVLHKGDSAIINP